MSDYEFTLPLNVTLERKTVKNKRVSININWFRSAHHRDYEEAKRVYCKLMGDQLNSVDGPNGKIHVHFKYYAARDNKPDLHNFVDAAKKFFFDAMVKHGFIEDDNVHVIVSSSEEYCGIDRKSPRIVAKINKIGE